MAHRAKCLHLGVSQVASECMSHLNGLMSLPAGTMGQMPTLHLGVSQVASECISALNRLMGLQAATLDQMPTLGCQPGGLRMHAWFKEINGPTRWHTGPNAYTWVLAMWPHNACLV